MAKSRKSAAKATKHSKSSYSGPPLSQKGSPQSRNVTGAILSQPSKASQAARRVGRTFEAGVASALRIARARGVAVTIQDKDGNLTRGVPRQRDGAFVIEKVDPNGGGKGSGERGRKH
jgi:hypothetical protein